MIDLTALCETARLESENLEPEIMLADGRVQGVGTGVFENLQRNPEDLQPRQTLLLFKSPTHLL